MHVALVCNPRAGNYSLARLDQLQHAFERHRHLVTRHDSQSFRLDQLAAPVDLICIAGGDGTVRTTIANNADANADPNAAAAAPPVPYCIFPMGTVNLVAREAGYRADAENFPPDILAGRRLRRHVAGRVDDEIFLCCASVGPDSHAVARLSPRLKERLGRFAYAVALMKLGSAWPRPKLQLDIDGTPHSAEALFILKGRYYAGPWALDRAADLASDRFRLLLLPQARRRDLMRLLLFAMFGASFADPRWVRRDARVVDILGPAGLPVQADGDIVALTPARICIDPEPMTFVYGADARIFT